MKEASESNSGEKVSHSNPSRRLKDDSACDNESATIDLLESAAEDSGSTARKNISQIIIPANE